MPTVIMQWAFLCIEEMSQPAGSFLRVKIWV